MTDRTLPSSPDSPRRRDRAFALGLAGLALLLVAAGFIAGARTGSSLRHRQHPQEPLEQRLGGYRFINPLLDCEVNGDPLTFRELRPFKARIELLLRQRTGTAPASFAAVYFRDLMNGPWFGINELARFTPASLLKVPIVIACLKQAERDPAFLRKQIRNDLHEDRNRKQFVKPGETLLPDTPYSVEELIRRALVYSDNNAAALLGKAVNKEVLLATFRDLGVEAPRMNIMYDFMTVKRYSSFFRILFNSSYLGHEASQKTLEHLAQSSFRDGLVAGVPAHVLVAHKFGEYAETGPEGLKQLHDCGIIYYPGHPYLLCVMARGTDFGTMGSLIRDVSRTVYDEVSRQVPAPPAEGLP